MTDLLAVDGLTVAIAGRPVVDSVSFTLAPGEVLALVGESGCGKSLTALALLGLLPRAARRTAGRIAFEGRDLATAGEAELRAVRGNRISIIFQEPVGSLDPLMTAGDQLVEAIRAHQPVDHRQARARALELMRAVGIAEPERRMAQYPFELSGGMCQRVMIGSALAARPAILLADEPTTALDVTIQAQILDLIKRLRAETGAAVLLITHDMGVVAEMADRVAVMYAGRIVETAPTEALFAQPRHPYTRLLLKSVPRPDQTPKSTLPVIAGTVPTAPEFGDFCRFALRCPIADGRCTTMTPQLAPTAAAHHVACWHQARVAAAPELA